MFADHSRRGEAGNTGCARARNPSACYACNSQHDLVGENFDHHHRYPFGIAIGG